MTADDFGKSRKANENILKLAREGKLDRISVMAEGDISSSEARELLATGAKLDIHFELIWQKRRRNLLKDHTVRQVAVFFVNWLWGDWPVPVHPRSGTRAVSREWKGQIEKFTSMFGRVPDGISSHEHIHYFPPYFRIALKLAGQSGIRFVRFGAKGFLGRKNSVQLILKTMRWFNKRKFLAAKIPSADYFASLDWLEDLKNFFENIPAGKTEIACHPEREEELQIIEKYF